MTLQKKIILLLQKSIFLHINDLNSIYSQLLKIFRKNNEFPMNKYYFCKLKCFDER